MWEHVEIDKLTSITSSIEIDLLKYRNLTHDGDAGQIRGKRRKFSVNGARYIITHTKKIE